ncbi:YcxB family protein [Haloplasma contractile]|uniref:YcxB-like protein n=1 Tax=Haloplasma contractile SSD-17B TaxID=1033810 RepID=U2E9I7_9MOLU|nr:YcxB family protein [Haloplasma contractile]ERJ11808.1 YcxB-like protein [Haloplasma contractile SSD-17B]
MKLTYEYTEEDYVNFYVHKHKNSDLKQRLLNQVLFTVTAVVSASLLWKIEFYITTIVGSIVLLISISLAFRQSLKKTELLKQKAYKKANYMNAFGENELITFQEGLSLGEEEGFIKWNEVLSIEEVDHYYFIYLKHINALKVPKRAFKNKREQALFLNTVKRHLN